MLAGANGIVVPAKVKLNEPLLIVVPVNVSRWISLTTVGGSTFTPSAGITWLVSALPKMIVNGPPFGPTTFTLPFSPGNANSAVWTSAGVGLTPGTKLNGAVVAPFKVSVTCAFGSTLP